MTTNTLPKTTPAAILVEQKKPLAVDEVTLPETLEIGQVLVDIRYSGICGSQLGEIDGVKGEDRFLPHLLGHEGAGTVLAVGPGVSRVRTGDTVVLHWRKGDGIEAVPAKYLWKGRTINAGYVTTFSRYSVVSENRVTPIHEGTDLRVATLFGCAVTTGLGVITNNANVKPGESVVVLGAGGVGLNVIQGADLVSAWPVIAVDRYDGKLDLAVKMGATHAVNGNTADVGSAVREILGGKGADVVVDNTGNTEMIRLAMDLTQPQGRTILVGVTRKGEEISHYPLHLFFGKTLTGSHGGESLPSADIPRYLSLYNAGILKLDELITDTFPLTDINSAIDAMRNGRIAGRCLIDTTR